MRNNDSNWRSWLKQLSSRNHGTRTQGSLLTMLSSSCLTHCSPVPWEAGYNLNMQQTIGSLPSSYEDQSLPANMQHGKKRIHPLPRGHVPTSHLAEGVHEFAGRTRARTFSNSLSPLRLSKSKSPGLLVWLPELSHGIL